MSRYFARRIAVTAAGLLVLASASGLCSTSAEAASAPVAQANPFVGVTVQGTALRAQLQVTGAAGAVTFKQTSGASHLSVSSRGVVSAASTLSQGTYTAGGTDSDLGGSGTWSFRVRVLGPAPSNFVATAVNVYQSIYNFDSLNGNTPPSESPSQYQQQISQGSAASEAQFYAVTQQYPVWYQIPAIIESAGSAMQGVKQAAADRTHQSSNAAYTPTTYPAADCSGGPGDTVVFALQIVSQVALAVYNGLMADLPVAVTLPAPLDEAVTLVESLYAQAANIVYSAAQIAYEAVLYVRDSYSGCDQKNVDGYLGNIDNTTVQSYGLLTTAASSLSQLQATAGTTDQDVLTAQNDIQSLQASLNQTLAQDTQTIQSALGTDTQTVLSQLQTDIGPVNAASGTQLTLQIEDALLVGSEGSVGNGLLMLPATAGGLLTAPASTPNAVSVQNVVDNLVTSLENVDGVTLSPTNQALSASGDGAVKAKPPAWVTAYSDFQGCYRALVATP